MSTPTRIARIGWVVFAVPVGLLVLVYAILVLVNLRDQPPSEETLRVADSVRTYVTPADEHNAYIRILAFSAPPDADALALGIARRDWMLKAQPEFDPADDPLPMDNGSHAVQPADVLEMCRQPVPACMDSLDARNSVVDQWIQSERWLYDRYRQLIRMREFRETVPYEILAPIPSYSDILASQTLLFVEALTLAKAGDPGALRNLLQDDLQFWRVVLQNADGLITKMISAAAISRHFKIANLVMRELPAEQVTAATPEIWRQPFSIDERSMSRVSAGESLFVAETTRDMIKENQNPYVSSFWNSIRWALMKPLWQPQDSINGYTALLMSTAKLFERPLTAMPTSIDAVNKQVESAFRPFSRAYNLGGDLLYADFKLALSKYAARVADLEGVRRAAILATDLRASGVTQQDAAAAILASNATDPYTGEPFTWQVSDNTIVFIGLEPNEKGTHSIHY